MFHFVPCFELTTEHRTGNLTAPIITSLEFSLMCFSTTRFVTAIQDNLNSSAYSFASDSSAVENMSPLSSGALRFPYRDFSNFHCLHRFRSE